MSKLNGVIVVNKESGMTSRDVVNELVKIFNTKKIGHTGTLDPLATGVLVCTIGKFTKLNELLTSTYKEYVALMKLGVKTDTYDIEGKILKETKVNLSKEEIKKVINSFKGEYDQTVPIYSSVKVKGKKLYEYARDGIEVSLPKRKVDIKELEILSIDKDIVKFKTLVSKGTYIRSLINDIGDTLGCGAIMTSLNRTKQGLFDIADSYTLNDIKKGNYKFVDIIKCLDLYSVEVDDYLYQKIKNGSILENRYNKDLVLFKKDNEMIAIYEIYDKDKSKIKPYKMF